MLRKLLMFGGFALAMAFMGGTAKADTLTYTQTTTFGTATAYLNVSTTATGGTATLTFGSDLNGFYTSEVGIQIAPGGTLTSANYNDPSGNVWNMETGNNAVTCSSTTGNWFCGYSDAPVPFQSGTNGLSFTWTFTGSAITPSVQFSICNSNVGTNACTHGVTGFVTNFSQSAPVNTPEPGTLYLLGAGLLPLLFFGRRFLGDLDSR